MEHFITKNRILIWIIIILAAINVSTLVTIYYHIKVSKSEAITGNSQSLETDTEKFSGRYFRDKLDFSSEQMDDFRDINHNFRRQAYDLTVNLSEQRKNMLDEMEKEAPDTIKLNNISLQIGTMHTNLKVLTYKYYLNLKKICNPKQQAILNELFRNMFQNDSQMNFPGRQGKRGNGHGMGNGRHMNNNNN